MAKSTASTDFLLSFLYFFYLGNFSHTESNMAELLAQLNNINIVYICLSIFVLTMNVIMDKVFVAKALWIGFNQAKVEVEP